MQRFKPVMQANPVIKRNQVNNDKQKQQAIPRPARGDNIIASVLFCSLIYINFGYFSKKM